MAHREYGIFLLSLSWFSCLLFTIVLYQGWNRRWKYLFSRQRWCAAKSGDSYWVHRSKLIIGAYLTLCFFELSIGRTLAIRQFLWDTDTFPGWSHGQSLLIIASATAVLSLNLARAWRLKISHKYYAEIANFEWARLMDASHNTHTFWIQHRRWLNSNAVVSVLILVYLVTVGSLMAMIERSNHSSLRWLGVSLVFCSVLCPLSIVWTVPDNSTFYKLEVKLTLLLIGIYVVLFGVSLETVRGVYLWRSLVLSLYQCTLYCLFLVIFIYVPRLNDVRKSQIHTLGPNENVSKMARRMFAVLSDESRLSSFARYSCRKMDAENTLAVLEIREFKQLCRHCISSEPNSPRWTIGSGRSFIRIPSVRTPTVSMNEQPSTPVSLFETTNEVTFGQLTGQMTDFSHPNPHWSAWDQHCTVSLSTIGARSSIVSDRDSSLRDKARFLCEKYFDCDADFSLNISHAYRKQVLSVVYDDAMDDSRLLYAFDGAVSDIFDNLYDTLLQFEAEERKQLETF